MNQRQELRFDDRILEGPERGPADGPLRVFEQTRSMRQRPAWSFVSTWAGSAWPDRRIFAPLAFAAMLILLAIAAAAIVGARPRTTPIIGPAGNGSFAWDTGQGGRVFLAGPDGSAPHPITGAYAITRSPAFSRDGSKLVFWSRPDQDQGTPLDLFSADADGSDVRRINGDLRLDVNVFTVPSWSPDGRHVVFDSVDRGVSRLYVATVDGSAEPVAITDMTASRSSEVWSPDGQWIAFHKVAPGPGGASSFSIIHPDGSDERDLHSQPDPVDGGADNGPVWAPDSSAIAYSRLGGGAGDDDQPWRAYLIVNALQGGERKIYSDLQGSISAPDWSPDGSWIAAGVGNLSPGKAIIVRPDGNDVRTFAPSPGAAQGTPDCGVRWSPDGRSVMPSCAGLVRFPISDLAHPEPLPLPSAAAGWDWQRAPTP